MRIFITGANGFIVSRLLSLLPPTVEAFLHVRSEAQAAALGKHYGRAVFWGDLSRGEGLDDVPSGIDVVLHAAGSVSGDAQKLIEGNVLTTAEVVRIAEKKSIGRIINLSTAAVYDGEKSDPISEETPAAPGTVYGISKLAGEELVRAAVETQRVKSAAVLRCNNIYGPGQKKGMVQALGERIWRDEPVRVDGDGGQLREPLYVDDAVAAVLAVLSAPVKRFSIYNVSGEEAITVRDLAKRLGAIAGKQERIVASGNPPVVPLHLRLDTGKLREATGWQPKISLDEGLRKTYAALIAK